MKTFTTTEETQALERAKLEIDKIGSILLYGNTGTGKTTIARAIARKRCVELITPNSINANYALRGASYIDEICKVKHIVIDDIAAKDFDFQRSFGNKAAVIEEVIKSRFDYLESSNANLASVIAELSILLGQRKHECNSEHNPWPCIEDLDSAIHSREETRGTWERYLDCSTTMTTNLSPKEFKSLVDVRTWDRLRAYCTLVQVEAVTSFRQVQAV